MKRHWLWGVVSAVLLLAVISGWVIYERSPRRGLPYHDSFAAGSSEEWTAYGGTWSVVEGAIRNESDERGAKLMTGSPWWTDYTVSADIELLGDQGDAGVILRGSDEEQGVDSYTGYYAGLRSNDGNLILGYAEHGWIQLAGQPMPGGVQPFHLYHLRASVQGCRFSAVATDSVTGATSSVSANDSRNCPVRGRIGIRSHSSGGIWKHIVVQPAKAGDLAVAALNPAWNSIAPIPYAVDEPVVSGGYDQKTNRNGSISVPPVHPEAAETVSNLKLVRGLGRKAVLRGTVVLTSPQLYVQDNTGGAAISGPALPNLKLGDEVEVHGVVDLHGYNLQLRDAQVRLLWARAPLPPVAITASQAATGAYDAMFVEVDGILAGRSNQPDGSLQLDFTSNGQSFRAIANSGRNSARLRGLALQSKLRLRGVCVVAPEFTRDLYPFVLLVPSADNIDVLAGPPWWSARSLAVFGLCATILLLLALLLYMRLDRWRLHSVLNERERIAHEMHDSLAQSFAGIGFQLQAISNRIPSELGEVNHQLDLACELVRHSHEEARRSLMTLRREFLENETLHSALEGFAARIVEHGSIQVSVDVNGKESNIPHAVKDALFRIGQEAIANSLRHAAPSRLRIRIEYAATKVVMAIEDNGQGFEPDMSIHTFGIQGMRKRAEAIAARLTITSSSGNGTLVLVHAPIPRVTSYMKNFRFWRRSYAEENERQSPYSYR
jgi:signal transduction histidine kinase